MSEWLEGDYRKDLNKEYLGHWDLPEGEDMVVTIQGVKLGTVRNQHGSETKPILHFVENIKPLVLNVINQKSITKALGTPKREMWRGRKIALFEGKEPKSDDGLAVRIRDYAPKVEEYICSDCGLPITNHGTTKAVVIANRALSAYGVHLCWDCAVLRKEAENAGKMES